LDFYPVYKEIDATVSECLVEPMFTSLNELVRDEADEKDVEAAAEMFLDHGSMLQKIRPGQCDSLLMALRAHLCDSPLRSATRRLVLQVRTQSNFQHFTAVLFNHSRVSLRTAK
uniref:ACC_central domain-containing protein n=1 Tax=Gongylonema pulchrum TaxID=637853 RepID=A0A183DH64_9BILA